MSFTAGSRIILDKKKVCHETVTFAFERAQNAGSDAVRALTPPAGQTFDERDANNSTSKIYTKNFSSVQSSCHSTHLKRRVGLGTGLGVRPLLLTKI